MADRKDRSRSRSPQEGNRVHRRRSISPRPNDQERGRNRDRERRDRPRGNGGRGFKWKEKHRDTDRDAPDRVQKRLDRGYRNRSPSPRRERPSGADRKTASNDATSVQDQKRVDEKYSPFPSGPKRDAKRDAGSEKVPDRTTPAAAGEPMIVVHVNDRLGTKAAIPCLASDPIRLFKAQVAARIGRQPHEILLKRQGERPFKDQLTLEDYGVSNGVQIDLEIDTGE